MITTIHLCSFRQFLFPELMNEIEPIINQNSPSNIKAIKFPITITYLASPEYLTDLNNSNILWIFSLETYVAIKKLAPHPSKVIYIQLDDPYRLDVEFLDCNVFINDINDDIDSSNINDINDINDDIDNSNINNTNQQLTKMTKMDYLKNCRLVLNYSNLYTEFYLKNKINFSYFPWGYLPLMEQQYLADNNQIIPSPIYDVFFAYSVKCDRRLHIINSLGKFCRVYAGVFNNNTKFNQCIAKSKICINVYFSDEGSYQPFDVCRIFPLISKKKFIISEKSTEPIMDQEFSHFIEIVAYNKIIDTVRTFLSKNKDAERQTRANQAHQYLQQHYPLAPNLILPNITTPK